MPSWHAEALTPAIGSLVHGIDLAAPDLVETYGKTLRDLLLERQVIFFREQELSPDAQIRFSQIFGEVRPVSATFPSHPDNPYLEILESKGKRTGTDVWHADLTWQQSPPAATCLYARTVPEVGGDTIWSSMTAAYESLDATLRSYIDRLTAIHNWEGPELRASISAFPDAAQRYEKMRLSYPPLEKPVVLTHPATGKRVLYVNFLYTTEIVGVGREESAALLGLLCARAQVPEWQVRFRWEPGSLAIWDNRSVQHYAVNDYHPARRLMHRVTIF